MSNLAPRIFFLWDGEGGIKLFKSFNPFKPPITHCGLILVLLVWSQGMGQTIIRHTKRPVITLEGNLKFTYDDNIFLYSTKDINDFRRSVRPYRFPFETTDDFITTLTGIVQIRPALGRQRLPLAITLRYRQHLFAVNRMKSYSVFSFNLMPNLTKELALGISYTFLPRYLIRFYKDPTSQTTPSTYIGCDFTEHLFGLEFKSVFRPRPLYRISLTPFYKYEICDYTKKFDFYDTKGFRFGLVGSFAPMRRLALNTKLEYKVTDAVGPNPDISYEQLTWSLGIGFGTNPRLVISYGQERREYVTDNPPTIDPFHFGRIDKTQNFRLELGLTLSRMISIRPSYEAETRKVTSPYKEDIDDIKDYKDNKIIVEFNLRRF